MSEETRTVLEILLEEKWQEIDGLTDAYGEGNIGRQALSDELDRVMAEIGRIHAELDQ